MFIFISVEEYKQEDKDICVNLLMFAQHDFKSKIKASIVETVNFEMIGQMQSLFSMIYLNQTEEKCHILDVNFSFYWNNFSPMHKMSWGDDDSIWPLSH